ncbi:RDD family protein [Paenibacillus pabuli]|uniref:RDD family protein n=1 Tax=Paenibacillus pabuli TaxID=1472 RepID=UPI003D6A331B
MSTLTAKPQETVSNTRAGVYLRVIAYLLDSAIAIPLCVLFMKLLGNDSYTPFFNEIIILLYFSLCNSIFGATPGKLILKLRVLNLNGEKLNIFRSISRELFKVVLAYILFINFAWLIFSRKRLTLHDIFAKTQVINTRKVVS